MAAQPPTLLAVPDADRAIDGRGDIWTAFTVTTDPYLSLWENTRTEGGATWALLAAGAYGPVLAYRSDEWAMTS